MKVKLPVVFALISLALYFVCLAGMRSGAEDIINGLIRQGNHDQMWQYSSGWGYSYCEVDQFLYITGVFLLFFYGGSAFAAIRRKHCDIYCAAVLATYIIGVMAILLMESHLFLLILGSSAVFAGMAAIVIKNDMEQV